MSRPDNYGRNRGGNSRNNVVNRRSVEYNYDERVRPQRTPVWLSGWDRDATPEELAYRARHFTERQITSNLSFQNSTQIAANQPMLERQAAMAAVTALPHQNINSAQAMGLLPSFVVEALNLKSEGASVNIDASQGADRQASRVYVGGVTANITDEDLRQFFFEIISSIRDRPVHGPQPTAAQMIRSVQHSNTYAFLEFIHKSDAEASFSVDGMVLKGVPLRVKAPKEMQRYYEENPPKRYTIDSGQSQQLFLSNLPLHASEQELFKLASIIGPVQSVTLGRHADGTPKGYAFVVYVNTQLNSAAIKFLHGHSFLGSSIECSLYSQATMGAQSFTSSHMDNQSMHNNSNNSNNNNKNTNTPQSRVVKITNMVTAQELAEEYTELMSETYQECSTFGSVEEVVGVGEVLYVAFKTSDDAARAIDILRTKKFDNKHVLPVSFNEQEFFELYSGRTMYSVK